MAAHVDAIAQDLAYANAGAEKAHSMVAEADAYVQRSVDAAARGGFVAMAANLGAAQQQLRELHAVLHETRRELAEAAAPVANAPKEIDAEQVVVLLGPLTGQVDKVRGGLTRALGQVPPVVQRIAASANQSPAIGILTNVQQQVLAQVLQRVGAVTQTISAALADAKAAQAGG